MDNNYIIMSSQDKNDLQKFHEDISGILDITMLKEKLASLANISEEISFYNEFLKRQLVIVEMEINDIRHYIEFTQLDECEEKNILKLFREKLLLRRKIKDELSIIKQLHSVKVFQFREAKIQSVSSYLECRKYKTKILYELFS